MPEASNSVELRRSWIWGVALLYGLVILLSFLSARSLFVAMMALTLIGVVGLRLQNRTIELKIYRGAYDLAFLAFVSYAAASSAWAPDPASAVLKSTSLLVPYVCLLAIMGAGIQSHPRIRNAALVGLLWAIILLGVLVAADVLTARALSLWLINLVPGFAESFGRHVRIESGVVTWISDAGIDRTILAITLCLAPAWVVVSRSVQPLTRLGMQLMLAGSMGVVLLVGPHQTSLVAAAMGLLVAAAQWIDLRMARRLLLIVWTIACGLVVPLCLWGYETAKLQDGQWLFSSARTRIFIWGHYARATLEHPMFGSGVNSASIFIITTKDNKGNPDRRGGDIAHPHNGYLQVWYELGLAGAVLFWWFGATALLAIGRLSHYAQRLMLPLAAVIMAAISTSYGLWQIWLLSAIALAVAFHGMALESSAGNGLRSMPCRSGCAT